MHTRLQQSAIKPAPSLYPLQSGLLHRKCACGSHTSGGKCAEYSKNREGLQRSNASNEPANQLPPIVHEVLRSPGQPLDEATRAFMEPRFGHDFSRVRVHSDANAAYSARVVNALAYTLGNHLVFETGEYTPETREGRRLIAHELVHTLQQDNFQESALTQPILLGSPDDVYERIAERVGNNPEMTSPDFKSNNHFVPARATAVNGAVVLRRTCSAHSDEPWYRTETAAKRYCQDSPRTSQLHPGQICFRQVPHRTGYFDCPPGDQVCFDQQGHCHDSWDEASPVEETNPDGTCNLHGACSLAHAYKDKVVQTWWDQNVNPIFERLGRQQIECVQTCQQLPWYSRGFCLQGCSGAPPM